MLALFIILFLIIIVLQLVFLGFFRYKPLLKTSGGESTEWPGISIIICARNEADNLRHLLPSVLAQDYPDQLWELIVINDASTDNSEQVLLDFQKQYACLKSVTISPAAVRNLPGKKYALDRGIARARFASVLLTDADCRPASDQWLRSFAICRMQTGRSVILGYGAYDTRPGFLNKFIRWETAHTAMQYLSFSRLGFPYMGVGRNLMYDRELYNQAKQDSGFWQIYRETPSGDDDLLISKIAHKDNTTCCLHPGAHTISIPETNWPAWKAQKKRHLSTGKFYAPSTRLFLGLYALSQGLFWMLWIFCLLLLLLALPGGSAEKSWLILACCAGGVRLLIAWMNAGRWYKILHEKKLIGFFLSGDFCWALYNLIFAPYIFWKNKKEWR